MPSAVQIIVPSHLLIVALVIMWVMTVPLFHTQLPDTTGGVFSSLFGAHCCITSPALSSSAFLM